MALAPCIIFSQPVADLDFSVMGGSLKDALDTMAHGLGAVGGSLNGVRLTEDNPPRIAYIGPLGRERTIKLDLADDELVFDTERRRLLPRWSDLPRDITVHVYTLLEIAGEKLRCVLQRLQCRDLFDLYLLFEEAAVEPAEAASVFRLQGARCCRGQGAMETVGDRPTHKIHSLIHNVAHFPGHGSSFHTLKVSPMSPGNSVTYVSGLYPCPVFDHIVSGFRTRGLLSQAAYFRVRFCNPLFGNDFEYGQ